MRGTPQTITYPDGTVKRAVVNTLGQITSVTDENGFTTSYQYDLGGRLSRVDLPIADQKSWLPTTMTFVPVAAAEYGIPAGHWTQTVSTGYRRKQTFFDALWRPLLVREVDVNDVAGTERFTRFEYKDGRQSFASYPAATSAPTTGTRTEYDALGRVTKVTQDSELFPLVTDTEYLPGFKTRITNPRRKQNTTSYVAYDTPTTDWPRKIDAPSTSTVIVRDPFGAPGSITRTDIVSGATATREYFYSDAHELCRTREPETGLTAMGYDEAGNLKWSASGLPASVGTVCNAANDALVADRITRSYDQRNRVTSMAFPQQSGDTSYTYTPDGLLATISGRCDLRVPLPSPPLRAGEGEEQDAENETPVQARRAKAHVLKSKAMDGLAGPTLLGRMPLATEGRRTWAFARRAVGRKRRA